MNPSVLRQTLRRAARTIAILSVASAAFYYLILLASRSFLNGQTTIEFFRHPPEAIEAFLGGVANFLEPSGWLAAGMTHPVTLALLTAAGLVVAAGAVAGEVERGTADLILSRPVGRGPFLVAKALAAVVAVSAVEIAGLAGVLIARITISQMAGIEVSAIFLAFLGSWVLFVSLAMVALLVSVGTSMRSRASAIAVGAVVGWFFLNFVALLIDGISPLRYASPFHYLRPGEIIAGSWHPIDFVVLAAVAVAALMAALWWFGRRDLTR